MMDFDRANRSNCPCRDCPDKGCGAYHGQCEKYQKWRSLLDERNKAERAFHRNNDTMSEAKKKSWWRSKRYSRQLTYNKSTKAD